MSPAGEPQAPGTRFYGEEEGSSGLRLPDFFIVGHAKCGTTALHMMLGQHPQVFMCPVKEPRFFAPELRSPYRSGKSPKRAETLAQYAALFAGAGPEQLLGEASPQYIRSLDAAARIAEVRPDARIIAVLREPASFLRSFHLQSVHNGQEPEADFGRAIALEQARREGRELPPRSGSPGVLLYSDHVRYVEQLRRLHAAFGRDQVLVLIYDDLRADNEQTVKVILDFLGADAAERLPAIETEPLRSVRFPALHRLAADIRVAHYNPATAGRSARALDRLIPNFLRRPSVRTRWRGLVYGSGQPPRDEQLMLELRRRFKPEVVALSEYLDRDLVALWGYEDLD
jgi:hypothetical protein